MDNSNDNHYGDQAESESVSIALLQDRWTLWQREKKPKDGTPFQIGGTVLGGLSATLAAGVEPPLASAVAKLALKHPESNWGSFYGPVSVHGGYVPPELKLRNIATWEAIGDKGYPGAQQLMRETRHRAFTTTLVPVVAGSAINYALDKTVYKSEPYGAVTAGFDTLGAACISGMPAPLPARYAIPIKTALIVGGHVAARWIDRHQRETKCRTDNK